MEKTQVGYNQSANKQTEEISRLMKELRQPLPYNTLGSAKMVSEGP